MSVFNNTTNGAVTYKSTGSHIVDLFFNIGSSRNDESIIDKFSLALLEDVKKATAILLWARDSRGGAGERGTFRKLISSLVEYSPELAKKVADLVPDIGRFDDLKAFWNTSLESYANEVWAKALRNNNKLAFKWVDRKDVSLRKHMQFKNEAEFRKFIANGRKNTVVEQQMCKNKWEEIEYSKIPSIAGVRYGNAFKRNDGERYTAFITSVENTVNNNITQPHEVYRAYKYGNNKETAEKYWNSLPDLGIKGNILPLVDVSSSMNCQCSGKITCLDVAVSLGTYLSQRIKGSFKNKMITFSESPEIVTLCKSTSLDSIFSFVENIHWGGNTNIEKAFDAILKDAIKHKVKPHEMPTTLLILSDMQFDQATHNKGSLFSEEKDSDKIESFHDTMVKKFKVHGYDAPHIVYWNLNASYGTYPTCKQMRGTSLISGFSSNVLKSVLSGEMFSPIDTVNKTIKKYEDMLEI